LKTLQQELSDGNALRLEQKQGNEATIAEATKQSDLLEQAVEILSKTASGEAAEQPELEQPERPERLERPDAPQARAGSSGLQGAITKVRELSVDQRDLAASTSASEQKAASDWAKDVEDKERNIKETKTEIQTLTSAIAKGEEDIYNANESLTIAKEEWKAAVDEKNNRIDPMCVQTAVSHEERAQKRNDEIQSLQEALDILSSV